MFLLLKKKQDSIAVYHINRLVAQWIERLPLNDDLEFDFSTGQTQDYKSGIHILLLGVQQTKGNL